MPVMQSMASWEWLSDEPALIEVEGAYLSPFRNRRISAEERVGAPPHVRRVMQGCAYTSAGEKVGISERQGGFGGDHVISLNPERLEPVWTRDQILRGKCLYLGHHMDHYGHFLTEFLSRLWPDLDFAEFDHVVAFPFIFGRNIREYQRDLVERLVGHDLYSRLTITKGDVLFESLTIPAPMIVLNRAIHPSVKRIYENALNSNSVRSEDGAVCKVFLSRSSQLKNQRISNIQAVEAVFSEFGFDIFYPEKMAIDDQLRLYGEAAVLAGFSGSALHNVVFTPPGTLLIEVGDERSPKAFLKTQSMLNAVSQANAHKVPLEQGEAKSEMDIEYLRRRLDRVMRDQFRKAAGPK